jgi:hypothetical protein
MPNLSRVVVLPVQSDAPLLICLLCSISQPKWLHWNAFSVFVPLKDYIAVNNLARILAGPGEIQ